MRLTSNPRAAVKHLRYQPSKPYPYDLEIFRVSDLRLRTREENTHMTYRYEFHMLMCITQGGCEQWVDFEPVSCTPGTLLALRPGQAHNFGRDDGWDGWVVLFRPEFLLPVVNRSGDQQSAFGFEGLPVLLQLNSEELCRASDSIEQMRDDALIGAQPEDVHALLRYQLYAVVTWLLCIHVRKQEFNHPPSMEFQRFEQFQRLVENHFFEWSQVGEYAKRLGCVGKSITRATTAVAGMSAKAFISARINLEAKRLLVHTESSISAIGEKLGFADPTHFVKFFKRETGVTPAEFRRQQFATSFLPTVKS